MKKKNWSTADIPSQEGKIIIVTGSTSGLGAEAVKVLVGKGAQIIMAVRNIDKADKVKAKIIENIPNAKITIHHLDLMDLKSIEVCANDIIKTYNHLDVLINNAGIMMCPFATTKDGFEIQMGTNHLGPFAFTGRLMPLLTKTKNARIVSTSSLAHHSGAIDFSAINWGKRKYKTTKAYGDSKIANLYFTYELADKLKNLKNSPTVTVAHPGWTTTDLQKHSFMFNFLNPIFGQDVSEGVLPTLRAAVDTDVNSGDYFGPSRMGGMRGAPIKIKSNKNSKNKQYAKELWALSEKLTGVTY